MSSGLGLETALIRELHVYGSLQSLKTQEEKRAEKSSIADLESSSLRLQKKSLKNQTFQSCL